jgi:hypothetical protein
MEIETLQKNWFDELPIEIQNSVCIGLKQSENNEGIYHEEVMKLYTQTTPKELNLNSTE